MLFFPPSTRPSPPVNPFGAGTRHSLPFRFFPPGSLPFPRSHKSARFGQALPGAASSRWGSSPATRGSHHCGSGSTRGPGAEVPVGAGLGWVGFAGGGGGNRNGCSSLRRRRRARRRGARGRRSRLRGGRRQRLFQHGAGGGGREKKSRTPLLLSTRSRPLRKGPRKKSGAGGLEEGDRDTRPVRASRSLPLRCL